MRAVRAQSGSRRSGLSNVPSARVPPKAGRAAPSCTSILAGAHRASAAGSTDMQSSQSPQPSEKKSGPFDASPKMRSRKCTVVALGEFVSRCRRGRGSDGQSGAPPAGRNSSGAPAGVAQSGRSPPVRRPEGSPPRLDRPMPKPTPWRRLRFKLLVNLYAPFLGAGVHVTRVAEDFGAIDVRMRLLPWNRNYVGTHFGGSLFAMADPWFMIILVERLGRGYVVWDKSGAIRFRKPGRGTVRASFEIPPRGSRSSDAPPTRTERSRPPSRPASWTSRARWWPRWRSSSR